MEDEVLIGRRTTSTPSTAAKEVQEAVEGDLEDDLKLVNRPLTVDQVVHTRSTLLDLTISGLRREDGGIPKGIIIEFFGPSGAGKTALLMSICASAQEQGGEAQVEDPEARLDQEYSQIYGVSIAERFKYKRPDTVVEMFDDLWGWKVADLSKPNVFAGDSVAALSTDMEMEDEDKMGAKRAKDMSAQLRKSCRLIANNGLIVALSNQIRMNMKSMHGGTTTTGGMGLIFYASLRINVEFAYPKREIEKTISFGAKSKELKKVIGVHSKCTVVKSSVDEPFRSCPLSIIFGYGIDTIRDELQYYKDLTGEASYDCFTKTHKSMDNAIAYIEDNNLESQLKSRTITLWNDVQKAFLNKRKRR